MRHEGQPHIVAPWRLQGFGACGAVITVGTFISPRHPGPQGRFDGSAVALVGGNRLQVSCAGLLFGGLRPAN